MSVSEQSPLAAGEALRFDQGAQLKSFLGLSLKNGLLNLVTLTLYRFWGKTEVRRRVWGSTYINDEPLEYTGRGKELFFGFLFALAIIGLPFLLIIFAVQFLGPVAALLVVPLYLFMFFLIGFGRFTAFRYMASRTVWRGIRFRLKGSASAYAWRYIGYAFLSGLTLGWYWPTAQRRLAAPLWGGLKFGDKSIRFSDALCRKEKVYGAFALFWFGVPVMYFVAAIVLVGLAFLFVGSMPKLPEAGEPSLAMFALTYGFSALILLLIAIAYAPFQAAILRSVVAGIVVDEASFKLDVKWTDMAWMTVSNVFLVVVTLGFLMPFVQARTAKFLIGRLSAEGLADLASVRQTSEGPKTGEGLADAFGLAPI